MMGLLKADLINALEYLINKKQIYFSDHQCCGSWETHHPCIYPSCEPKAKHNSLCTF